MDRQSPGSGPGGLTHLILVPGVPGQVSDEAGQGAQLVVVGGPNSVQQRVQDALLLQSQPAQHARPLQAERGWRLRCWRPSWPRPPAGTALQSSAEPKSAQAPEARPAWAADLSLPGPLGGRAGSAGGGARTPGRACAPAFLPPPAPKFWLPRRPAKAERAGLPSRPRCTPRVPSAQPERQRGPAASPCGRPR